jgi:hypothetical protein
MPSISIGPRGAAVFLALGAASCRPEFDEQASLVTGPVVLAVQAEPAEALPLQGVALEALYVDASGPRSGADLDWAFCIARKPLTDLGTIAPACLSPEGESLVPLGRGAGVDGPMPTDACRLFGPDLPPPLPDEPTGRRVDPDPSGGFYQPVRLAVQGLLGYVVGTARIRCGLADATAEQSIEYQERYRTNVNPSVASLAIVRSEAREVIAPDGDEADASVAVKRGEKIVLEAAWPGCAEEPACGDGVCTIDEEASACPEDCTIPVGCPGAERYLLFDPERRGFAEKREAITVSWYATGGAFASDRTGRDGDDERRTSENAWTAPDAEGETRLWIVLRDDRGGVGWQSYRVRVRP